MNPLILNISLVSLATHHYLPSPLFTKFNSNLYIKDIVIDRSFSSFIYNNRYVKLKKSNFLNFIDTTINIDYNDFIYTGYFQSELNISGIQGGIKIIDSLFLNITGSAVIHNNAEYTSISILNSQLINIRITDSAINLQQGASLIVNSSCFFSFQGLNSVFRIKVFFENKVSLNYSSFIELNTQNHLIDCSNCSFYMRNDNFTSNDQESAPLMISSSMNYFSVVCLNLMNSITNAGFLFPNLIDLVNFTLINVNNLGKNNRISYVFEVKKGSIYIYNSSFNINSKSNLININTSTAFFYGCKSSVQYNNEGRPLMLWAISCLENLTNESFIPANPNFYVPLSYCENESFPDPESIQILINDGKPRVIRDQQKGATEILGILLFCVLGVSIIALSLWLILYFVVYKTPLKEFENDDQTARWKARWDWIIVNTNKASIEHKDCSDMELDPIELSEDAIKRRHQEIYNNLAQGQFSESQNSVSESFAEVSQKKEKKKKRSKNQNQNKEDELNKDEDDIDKIGLNNDIIEIDEKSDSIKSETDKDETNKALSLSQTAQFKKLFNKHPKNSKSLFLKDKIYEDESSKNKNGIKKSKADDDDDESDNVIPESDDSDADNDKINNDLEKTKSAWNRIQKVGFDKSLGNIDESSSSSFRFKNKKFNLSSAKQKEEQFDSSNIWSDDKKDKDGEYEEEDDDDIWSDEGNSEGEGDDDDDISDID